MQTAPNKTFSRSTNATLSIIIVAAFLISPSAFGIFGDLFKNELNVIINTDLTAEGKKVGLPTPNNPVYIDGVFYGFNNLGTAYGHQKEPPAEDMVSGIFKELHKQGYIFTTERHPPTQLITIHWGTRKSYRLYRFDSRPRQVSFSCIISNRKTKSFNGSHSPIDPLWLRP